MPAIDFVVQTECSSSTRARQLESIFDVPRTERSKIEYRGSIPIEDFDWNVGLIVGPSGSGKSTILHRVFGQEREFEWSKPSVVDDFDSNLGIETIAGACQAVGFNTIPAWLRPHKVLSTGEKFRVDMARRLLEIEGTIVLDEFTSVVDRQVAKIGSHAVQRYVRKHGKKFVAASCHYDIIDWLQPDWTFEPATMTFTRRSVQPRPETECSIGRVTYDAWKIFSPFHYLTADLNKAARCYGLFINGRIASFCALLYRPHPRTTNVWGISRRVTLPDFQGMGLAFALGDRLAAAYKARGRRVRGYPAHPAYIRSYDRSPNWVLKKRPGNFSPKAGSSSSISRNKGFGGRPCAVFEYCGPAGDDSFID